MRWEAGPPDDLKIDSGNYGRTCTTCPARFCPIDGTGTAGTSPGSIRADARRSVPLGRSRRARRRETPGGVPVAPVERHGKALRVRPRRTGDVAAVVVWFW